VIRRGGPQIIPRPPDALQGSPAPWAEIPAGERHVDLAALRAAFEGRGAGRPSWRERAGVRASAVLAPAYEHDGELHLLFTRRSWNLRAHRGEVCFPGGRVEHGESPADAACREAQEEIALDPGSVEILGELDHLATVSSQAFIVPLVAVLAGRPEGLVPNPGEVDEVLHVPADELLEDGVFREELWRFGGDLAPIFFFELVGDTIWGATAALLRQLLGWCLGLDVDLQHG
jgi:8-oxo-dGTP pyrophosphatase MutT (NUDIX family)